MCGGKNSKIKLMVKMESKCTCEPKMATTDEKLCLQRIDFKENVCSAFGDLRQDKEFTDVTLVCEDGQQVEAHKVVLVASSPFFQNILKRNSSVDLHEGCEA